MLYHIVFIVVITQAIQIQPVPRPSRQEFTTVLSAMRQELTSSLGSCSFPPKEVLLNTEAEPFKFLEKCNKPILSSSPHKDEDTLLCAGLLDVGLQICGIEDNSTFMSVTRYLPHNSKDFQSLVTDGISHQNPNFCTALKESVVEPQSTLTRNWNFNQVLQRSDKACSRLCYDYNGDENVLCQLILFGSEHLPRRRPSTIDDHSRPISAFDNNKPDSSSAIVENQQGPTNIDSLASKPSLSQRLGQPQTNSKKLVLIHNLNSSKQGESSRVPEQTQGSGTDNDAMQYMLPNLGIASSVNGREKLAEVQINESPEGSAGRTVQKEVSANNGAVKTDPMNNYPKPMVNPTSFGSSSAVSKTELGKSTVQSQEVKPNVEAGNSQEFQQQKGTNPSIEQAVSKSVGTSRSTGGAVDAIPQDVAIPNEAGEAGLNEEPGAEQFGNEDQPFQGDDDDQNIPNDDVGFENPNIKNEVFGNEKSFAKQPQEEMNNGNAYVRDRFVDSEDSHFFSYFLMLIGMSIIGYLVFHNKQKILALAVEGRARRGNRRRPNTANYHKLDSNLEEAVSSPCNNSSTHVIY